MTTSRRGSDRQWEDATRDTRRWRADARAMKAASDLLRDEWLVGVSAPPPVPGASALALPALLLGGYAVELFAKARIIDLGEGPAAWRRGRGHDLPWLVERSGIQATEAEARVLRRTKRIVTWAGRYPAPLEAADFMPEGEPWARQVHDSDFERIDDLCQRLAEAP